MIRCPEERDLDALCQLYYDFHQYHVQGMPDRLNSLGDPETWDHSELKETLCRIIGDSGSAILLAEDSGRLVGLAEVYIRRPEPNPLVVPCTYAYLQSLVVLESARGQGIGSLLMQSAEEWARKSGAAEMRLEIWEFPGGPLHFYERLGYSTLQRTLVKKIE